MCHQTGRRERAHFEPFVAFPKFFDFLIWDMFSPWFLSYLWSLDMPSIRRGVYTTIYFIVKTYRGAGMKTAAESGTHLRRKLLLVLPPLLAYATLFATGGCRS